MIRPFILGLAFISLIQGGSAAQTVPTESEALDLIRANRWAEAADAYEMILDANPFHGTPWYYYGLALQRSGDCEAALPAFERSIELGVNRGRSGLRAAMRGAADCEAALGDLDRAFDWLREASGRWEFDDWDGIEADSNYADLIGQDRYRLIAGRIAPDTVGRVEGWRFDLDYIADLMERRHPNLFHTADEETWRAHMAELRARVPELSDLQITGGLLGLFSEIGDGHTSLYPPLEGPIAFTLLPIWPYYFDDAWYVLAASPEQADLVGARILGANGVPADRLFSAMAGLSPRDNDMTFRWIGAFYAQTPQGYALSAGGGDPERVSFDLELASGERRTVSLEGKAADRNPLSRWAPEGWPSMTGGAATPTPLWLSHLDETFWVEDLDEGTVYVQINQIANAEDERFSEFAARLGSHLRDADAHHLILDLRLNNGGNGYLNWDLVQTLIRNETIDREGGLYVITGRRTFSAAVLLTAELDRVTEAIFVGEPAGSAPNVYANDSHFSLPYSGLEGSISNGYLQRSTWEDLSPWTPTDISAPLTVEAAVAGRDPALEAALTAISGGM